MESFLNTTLRNVAWFKQASEYGQLEMKPTFQRNQVWTVKQKSYLIDTILNGYPIPEIYMQESVDEEGKIKHIVVDGQQRLTSVLGFLAGDFTMDENDSPMFEGAGFEDLSPSMKKSLFQYNFVVRILPEVNEDLLREIFQRLNRNVVSLNRQELRQAIYSGDFINMINSISDYEEFEDMGLFTANDRRRMLDAEFVSELVIAMKHGLQNKKQTVETFYQYYGEHFDEISGIENDFRDVLREIKLILPSIKETRWKKKTDFYSLFFVIASHKHVLPLASDKRIEACRLLTRFGEDVSEFQIVGTDKTDAAENVKAYAEAVRASSDLSCRRARNEVLEELLCSLWQ